MKRISLLLSLFFFVAIGAKAQGYYNDILTYWINDYPVNGIKIKTTLPLQSSVYMPTIKIEGYAYGSSAAIDLTLVLYYFGSSFTHCSVSSAGSFTPKITVAGENGKVVIFLDSKDYFQRVHVGAFANGKSEIASWFAGWTAVDSTLLGTASAVLQVPYANRLVNTTITGITNFPGGSIWDTTGRVGIGTLYPSAKLSVAGPNANDAAMTIQSGSDSRFYISEGDNTLRIGGLNASTGVINVINTGNVGIGTTNPGSYKLAVEGTVGARKVQVKQASWADFVFDSAYRLPALSDVKKYITDHKHLPGIPSAKEVENDGIDIGEMNKKLLQKVEELTLYIIEQQQQIDQLKAAKH
jgi:hypothetical protein